MLSIVIANPENHRIVLMKADRTVETEHGTLLINSKVVKIMHGQLTGVKADQDLADEILNNLGGVG